MRTLLTTTPRNPTYTESEDMQNNSNAYICSPPFINAIFTLQINPGNVNKNNTCKTTAMLTFALRLSSMQYSLSRSIQEM
jgi:Tfp pilus assembly protein PilE